MTQRSDKGHLFIISGPSGAGKGTLRKVLFQTVPGLVFSVSCTTRSPRQGEINGQDYHFIDEDSFQDLIDKGQFLEWAKVHGNYYGTLKKDIRKVLDEGKDVILEIDVQGAHQVRQNCEQAIMIFVAPPSMEELEERLRKRGTEDEEVLQVRLNNARGELGATSFFDHVVINDVFDRAVSELEQIIMSYKYRSETLEAEL